MLLQKASRSICSRDRENAGSAPLRAGHPITWSAINSIAADRFAPGTPIQ